MMSFVLVCKIVLSVQRLELFAVVFELSLVAVIQASGQAMEEVLCRRDSGRSLQVVSVPTRSGRLATMESRVFIPPQGAQVAVPTLQATI